MDPQTDLPELVEDLEVNIDELSEVFSPLLSNPISKTAASLPLLEKAKLYVLAAYSIESLLFSTLQASGADARSHALFTELGRLKGYFGKIKDAEEHIGKEEKRAKLDVGAAQRFIKHGLAGNERYDEMRKERMAKEKERALEKARKMTNKKFSDDEDTPAKKRSAGEVEGEAEGTPNKKSKMAEKDREEEEEEDEDEGEDREDEEEIEAPSTGAKKKREGGKAKHTAQDDNVEETIASQSGVVAEPGAMDIDSPTPAKKKRGRPSKKDKTATASAEIVTPQKTESTSTPVRATRSSAPKTRSEAFQALASGSPASATKTKGKGKGRGKAK